MVKIMPILSEKNIEAFVGEETETTFTVSFEDDALGFVILYIPRSSVLSHIKKGGTILLKRVEDKERVEIIFSDLPQPTSPLDEPVKAGTDILLKPDNSEASLNQDEGHTDLVSFFMLLRGFLSKRPWRFLLLF